MNSLSLSNLQVNLYSSSPYFGTTLGGVDQNGKKIDVLHVALSEENGKLEPLINEWFHGGKSYHLSECNSLMNSDFRALIEKNLIILHNNDKMEILVFSGFEKYGKISKHSQFCCSKLFNRSSLSHDMKYRDNSISHTSFKMLDKKTSDCVKKSLMDIAWWFDQAPNETSKKQYEIIQRNQLLNNIPQITQPIFSQTINTTSQTTSVPSRTKALPTLPSKPINNTPSSSIISNGSTNTFKSLSDFQGNNFEKDCETPPDQLIKTAIELAKKEGFTKFEISNSFKKNIEVYPEPYKSKTNLTYHKVKVDFFIEASNGYGKNCQLVLQRQFFTCYSDKNVVIQKITDTANNILDLI
ncbi:MAG: hypothetical protein H0V82_00475 [Candidatus Protochlamydia sp.]|nr:hypothetical protein [Candidatus Protochlamydia sp.]